MIKRKFEDLTNISNDIKKYKDLNYNDILVESKLPIIKRKSELQDNLIFKKYKNDFKRLNFIIIREEFSDVVFEIRHRRIWARYNSIKISTNLKMKTKDLIYKIASIIMFPPHDIRLIHNRIELIKDEILPNEIFAINSIITVLI